MFSDGDSLTPGSLLQSAELGKLEALQDHLSAAARQFGLDQRRTGLLSLALEEIFVNICHYAYPDAPGPVVLNCRSEGEKLVVEIVDHGQAFDPATIAEPDLAAGVETRRVGGLGWFLVRQVADVLDCFREDGRNVVRLTLNR
ncbi:MAG: putative anti-sigma regulatory factor, serine/threonine protein kinase [Proteobacteria bacterium]|nr:putative anti-sigma regulatory factor, serine/threonine protein kinase [Pseudomonadota bacterium]